MIIQKENKTNYTLSHTKAIESSIRVLQSGNIEDLFLKLDLEHDTPNNLTIKLVSPNGTTVNLPSDNTLPTRFDRTYLQNMIGQNMHGDWTIKISDNSPTLANGTARNLNAWALGIQARTGTATDAFMRKNKPDGLISSQFCEEDGTISSLKLNIDIDHPSIGDLTCKLVAPSGKSVIFHDRVATRAANLKSIINMETLADFRGEQAKGPWSLYVKDVLPKNEGIVKSWKLDMVVRKKRTW